MAVTSPATNPWMTSTDLIASVQRKIAIPLSQNTFSPEDILAFANEEMFIAQVPSVLEFHEEYFTYKVAVPLIQGQNVYPIPQRAIGMRLRSLFWQDVSGNLFDMTRVNADDQAFFQTNVGANQAIHKFFFQGDNVVVTPSLNVQPTGSLLFVFFLRPNQLVTNDRAAIANGFTQSLTVNNASLVAGDQITIQVNLVTIPQMIPNLGQPVSSIVELATFTAVAGAPAAFQFQIGATSIATATNLVAAINSSVINTVVPTAAGTQLFVPIDVLASNGSPSTNIVTIVFPQPTYAVLSSNALGLTISPFQGVQCDSVPINIKAGSLIDFLQTRPGHRTYTYDIKLPSINGDILNFPQGLVPNGMVVGDYVCLANECIIPQIPSDLHNGLAERTCGRILAAQGDMQGFQASMGKIQEIEKRQGNLLDNRGEGDVQKIGTRHSILSFTKMGVRRRF